MVEEVEGEVQRHWGSLVEMEAHRCLAVQVVTVRAAAITMVHPELLPVVAVVGQVAVQLTMAERAQQA